jgi:hypothetical protein
VLFNKDLLFVHVPKTGGLSTTRYLLDVLPRPVWLSHPIWDPALPERGIVQIDGSRHETLAEARDLVASHGFALEAFPLILATVRNPYDLEVSRWAYLRQGHHWERGPEQDLALASSFGEFAVKNEQRGGGWTTGAEAAHDRALAAGDADKDGWGIPGALRDFFEVDGQIPANLRLLRFERLAEELAKALASIGVAADPAGFPWDNASSRDDFRSYYSAAAEAAVYRRYRWVFDQGFYPRLDVVLPGRVERSEPVPAAGVEGGIE